MNKNKFSVKNKIIIVCGGSGQLGKSLIKFLLQKKAIIINLDLFKYNNNNKNYYFYNLDLRNERDVDTKIKTISSRFKKIDVLINLFHYKGKRTLKPNNNFFSAFHNYSFEYWNDTVNTNLNGLFLICKSVIGEMIKKKSGIILNTSSTYGLNSPKHFIYGKSGINSPISYATTKAAIINFTKYLATYYSKYNIRINTISPGGIENKNQSKNFKTQYLKQTPLNRMAKDSEYNEAILFLISDASSYMTGANLVIDGGWTAW